MTVDVQPLTSLGEIDDVLEIEEASFTNPWTREMYLAELSHDSVARVLLARDAGGRVVGFCSFWGVLDELHVNNLAVRPEHRRAGVGSALIESLLAEAGRRGARQILLEVRRSNGPARALYERFGFAVLQTRRGYYTHPEEDALVLSRLLAGPRNA